MKKHLWLVGVTGLVLAPVAPVAHAKTPVALMGSLAKGTVNNIIGNQASAILTNLGVFDMIGLGAGTDPVIDAKLDQIIMQLQVVQTDITDLKMDVATLTNTVIAQQQMSTLQALATAMDDAQGRILMCAQQVALVAQQRGTDASDQQMHDFALQMVGRQAGPCDLGAQFQIIHDRIVTNPALGTTTSGFYSLLGQVGKPKGVTFDQIATHFVQYALTQREALELVRGAYSALGEPDNLQVVLTMPPNDFIKKLRDEEVAFLQGADAFITAGGPAYDPSPAQLADAIVQRLEGVSRQATTYSLSILDNATALSPQLVAPGTDAARPMLAMGDTIAGAVSSYYATGDAHLTIGLGACQSSPPTDGFAYVRPLGAAGGGFKMGSSCVVHAERHLLKNLPTTVAADWTVQGRHGTFAIGAPTLLNAATLATETAAEALALAGDPGGRSSNRTAFTLAADPASPDLVTLALDLPGQAGTPIRVGTAHAFAAVGTGAVAQFRKLPFGPQYPDRFALEAAGASAAQFLTVAADGFAALAGAPTWFDLERTADGHVELVYDGGVVYVDDQTVQVFHGESPDDVWATAPDLAMGATAVRQWTVPADGVLRVPPTTSLAIPSPCLTIPLGMPGIASYQLGPIGSPFPSSKCSDNDLAYWAYIVNIANQDTAARAFKVTLGAQAQLPSGQTAAIAGLHCFAPGIGSPDDHFDTDFASVSTATPSAAAMTQMFDPSNRTLTIPANGTFQMVCQILDEQFSYPAQITLSQFVVTPCKGTAGGTCGAYP